jgi:hypothetical protein
MRRKHRGEIKTQKIGGEESRQAQAPLEIGRARGRFEKVREEAGGAASRRAGRTQAPAL